MRSFVSGRSQAHRMALVPERPGTELSQRLAHDDVVLAVRHGYGDVHDSKQREDDDGEELRGGSGERGKMKTKGVCLSA